MAHLFAEGEGVVGSKHHPGGSHGLNQQMQCTLVEDGRVDAETAVHDTSAQPETHTCAHALSARVGLLFARSRKACGGVGGHA